MVIATAYLELIADGATGENKTAKAVNIDREISNVGRTRHDIS